MVAPAKHHTKKQPEKNRSGKSTHGGKLDTVCHFCPSWNSFEPMDVAPVAEWGLYAAIHKQLRFAHHFPLTLPTNREAQNAKIKGEHIPLLGRTLCLDIHQVMARRHHFRNVGRVRVKPPNIRGRRGQVG